MSGRWVRVVPDPQDHPFIMRLAKRLFWNQCSIMHDHEDEWARCANQPLWIEQARAAAAFVLKDFDKITPEMQDAGRTAVLEGNGFNWIYRAVLRARAHEIGVEIAP